MNITQKPGKYLFFIDIALFALLAGGVIWLLLYSSGRIGYNWQWPRFVQAGFEAILMGLLQNKKNKYPHSRVRFTHHKISMQS
jgi:hypothetical protein